jgi:hypothetical protein
MATLGVTKVQSSRFKGSGFWVQRSKKDFNPSTLNGERRTFEPLGFKVQHCLRPQASSLIEEETVKFR